MKLNHYFLVILLFFQVQTNSQSGAWQLWASGLPGGTYPRMTIAPDHSIYYTLVGTASTPGVIYKANTSSAHGMFTALPAIPLPKSHQNNVQCFITNNQSELISGIFRNDIAEPWLFKYDESQQIWSPISVDVNPSLGAYCIARAKNGTIWVGAKWSWVYISKDGGNSFQQINESDNIKSNYPCYFPSWYSADYDGAIYGINVDNNNRVYAGTESAGVIYSDDEGKNWQPADLNACQLSNLILKDSTSILRPLSQSGNVAGIGFTIDNKLIWTGTNIWTIGWKNSIACADLDNKMIYSASGLPDYLVQTGQQVSKIVTTNNGQIFFHSGNSNGATGIGIYTSIDGINWNAFNNGITGFNDGQSQGSLAVDGNVVFFATHDGTIWKFDADSIPLSTKDEISLNDFSCFPNPSSDFIVLHSNVESARSMQIKIYNAQYQNVITLSEKFNPENNILINLNQACNGLYLLEMQNGDKRFIHKFIVHH